jgi:hypothetical protein
MGLKNFFKKAFADMKEDAKAQHELDKANFNATKAEAKAQWETAKRTPEDLRTARQLEREEQIANAKAREEAAKSKL